MVVCGPFGVPRIAELKKESARREWALRSGLPGQELDQNLHAEIADKKRFGIPFEPMAHLMGEYARDFLRAPGLLHEAGEQHDMPARKAKAFGMPDLATCKIKGCP